MKQTPTPLLRFVERQVPLHPMYKKINERGETVNATQTVRILQQFWKQEDGDMHGQWRDIPVEQEAQP